MLRFSSLDSERMQWNPKLSAGLHINGPWDPEKPVDTLGHVVPSKR